MSTVPPPQLPADRSTPHTGQEDQHESLEVPEFYGEGAATEFMTGIAAPLLAGAAVAIIGVVVQQPSSLRWPGVTLLLLVLAASSLVAAVQFGFLARRHTATPDQVAAWWPALTQQARARRVRRDLEDDAPLFAWWADFARWAYGLGIVVLWIGLGVAITPDAGNEQPTWRWLATAVAWVVALLEVAWFVASRTRPGWFTPRAAARRRYYGKSE